MIIEYLFIDACGASTWLVPLATCQRVASSALVSTTSSVFGIFRHFLERTLDRGLYHLPAWSLEL